MRREIPAWGHLAYAIGGLFTLGWLWAAWLVHAIMNSQHNNAVRQQEAMEYAEWDRLYGDAWRAQEQARQQAENAKFPHPL